MKEKEIVKILRAMGNESRYQAMSGKQQEAGRRRLMFDIGGDPDQPKQFGWQQQGQMVWHQFKENALRPLAVGLTAFVFMVGGWAGMVSASFDSVPGDVLYPVKIANEKAQLAMALSGERKAKLHVEFASRRLDEIVTITASDSPEKETRVKMAVENFTKEITAVSEQIDQIKAEDIASATELAKIVDRKVDEYEATISQTEADFPEENQGDVAVAKEVVNTADNQAVEVLVENHESTQEEATAADLERTFQKDYASIQSQLALSSSRIETIEGALSEYDLENEAVYVETVAEAKELLAAFEPMLSDALDLMAAGGYRAAFEDMQFIDDELGQVSSSITALEISITADIAAFEVEAEEPAEEEVEVSVGGIEVITTEDSEPTPVF